MPTELRKASPKARKLHECSLCLGPIHPGETYSRATLIYDGTIYDWRTCPTCIEDRILSEVDDWCGSPEEGVGPDAALEWAEENWEQNPDALALMLRGHHDPRVWA